MHSRLTILLIAALFGYLGGISSHLFGSKFSCNENAQTKYKTDISNTSPDAGDIVALLSQLQQKIGSLEIRLDELAQNKMTGLNITDNSTISSTPKRKNRSPSTLPSLTNLLDAGVEPLVADDIIRRINQQYYRRLELQNLMQRNAVSGVQQYREELHELNHHKISLRSELGEDKYDKYLFISGQDNRLKVTSVIPGSPAESSGFQKGDIIIFYDNAKILNLPDMREATVTGEIGQLTTVEILRDGTPMSLTVPRGTLGIQLEATQLDPTKYQ